MKVELDTRISLELWTEGLANEARYMVNRKRKELGLKLYEPLSFESFQEATLAALKQHLKDTEPWVVKGYIDWLTPERLAEDQNDI